MFYFLERLYVDFYFVFVSLWYRLIITVAFPPKINRIWIGKMKSLRMFNKHPSPKSLN